MVRSLENSKGKRIRTSSDEDESHVEHIRSIHEMTCYEQHAKMAADGKRKCAECGEDLRPLQGRKLK